jgi:hypothetical protein
MRHSFRTSVPPGTAYKRTGGGKYAWASMASTIPRARYTSSERGCAYARQNTVGCTREMGAPHLDAGAFGSTTMRGVALDDARAHAVERER